MSSWTVTYLDEALKDISRLDGSVKQQVAKAIKKVSQNPLPKREGGYGVELGKKAGHDLSDCLKIKLSKAGIRVVYRIQREESQMNIIIVGIRANLEVYVEAAKRLGR